MGNFDSELFGLVFPGFQATPKIHARNSRPELSAFLSIFTFLNPKFIQGDFLLTGKTQNIGAGWACHSQIAAGSGPLRFKCAAISQKLHSLSGIARDFGAEGGATGDVATQIASDLRPRAEGPLSSLIFLGLPCFSLDLLPFFSLTFPAFWDVPRSLPGILRAMCRVCREESFL